MSFLFFCMSSHLLSLKHGAVGRKWRAGFLIEFTVTFKEGSPQVPHEAQVHPTQTCCWALRLTSTHMHRYPAHRKMKTCLQQLVSDLMCKFRQNSGLHSLWYYGSESESFFFIKTKLGFRSTVHQIIFLDTVPVNDSQSQETLHYRPLEMSVLSESVTHKGDSLAFVKIHVKCFLYHRY